jgi:hypothetical protein
MLMKILAFPYGSQYKHVSNYELHMKNVCTSFMKIYRREIGTGEIMIINNLGLIKFVMKVMFKIMDFQGNYTN